MPPHYCAVLQCIGKLDSSDSDSVCTKFNTNTTEYLKASGNRFPDHAIMAAALKKYNLTAKGKRKFDDMKNLLEECVAKTAQVIWSCQYRNLHWNKELLEKEIVKKGRQAYYAFKEGNVPAGWLHQYKPKYRS